MTQPRYLTKSRFKLACQCPTKLYYTGKPEYANQSIDDPFLMALAKGGFQVGELAKCYFPGGVEVKTTHSDYAGALERTNELLEAPAATIFEAAVSFGNFFIRVDILIKDGDSFEVIEAKAKSCGGASKPFFGSKGFIDATWKSYLYDIAFQKMVVQNAFPNKTVRAYLMLADKDSACPSDGLHQKFRIKTDDRGRKYAEKAGELTAAELSVPILRKINVDAECDRIFAGTDTREPEALSFEERACHFADSYARDERLVGKVSPTCKTCEFRLADGAAAGDLCGYSECWTGLLGWTPDELKMPTVLDVWDLKAKDKLIAAGKIKLSDLNEGDIGTKASERPGLSRNRRQWLQVEKACSGDTDPYIDYENLAHEMASWKFPLHFIDFETATPAIPFNKGRRPYEEIAFQFSHHVVHEDGRIEHAGQYLNASIGEFPNYDFLRALQKELMTDNGTIFRYAAHENSYLNAIRRQLKCEQNQPDDCDDLCAFIELISKSKDGSVDEWCGERNMVDMLELVKRFYYHPAMGGSNSIKKVLPAMLESSEYLRNKYTKAVYNGAGGVTSLNFAADWVWIDAAAANVADPYKKLPKLFASEVFEHLDDEDLADGGAAMTAYARLQFEDLPDGERDEIRSALLRYCELDTLAMVMIYEGWRELIAVHNLRIGAGIVF